MSEPGPVLCKPLLPLSTFTTLAGPLKRLMVGVALEVSSVRMPTPVRFQLHPPWVQLNVRLPIVRLVSTVT